MDDEALDAAYAKRRAILGDEYVDAVTSEDDPTAAEVQDYLTATAWGTKDFYIEDPDGYVICFGGRPAAG